MNAKNKSVGSGAALSVLAVVALLAVAFGPAFLADDSQADTVHTATINIQPGQIWEWTPSFTSSLSPTITVAANNSAMPTSGYSATSGYASVSSGKVTVSMPSDYSGSKYYVSVLAQTAQPTQKAYYNLTFDVAAYSMSYNIATVHAKVGTAISDLAPTVTGAAVASYSISGTLPAGLTFNTSTGVISGTPTAHKAQTSYTITANLNTVPAQSVTATVSIGAYVNITASSYTAYAIKGQTAVSVPGVAMPAGTALSAMTLTATKDGTGVSVNAGTAYNGMTVAANTGAVIGTPGVAGVYVFTEKYTATAATGGSSATRTVTVVVEDMVAVSGPSSFNSFVGHEDSVTLTKSAGPSAVSWSISAIKKNGAAITSGTDFTSFSVSNGVLKSGAATSAGTYVVTVKLATSSTATTTSGATGASASANFVTKDVTLTVRDRITASAGTFYMAEGGAFDPLTLTSNIPGAAWVVTDYGGLPPTALIVSSGGAVSAGTVSSGLASGTAYTVTVKAQDPANPANTATTTLAVHVAEPLDYTSTPVAGIIKI